MLNLLGGILKSFKKQQVKIDNLVFRFNRFFTPLLLMSFSVIVTSKQLVGDPINCFHSSDVPSKIMDSHCFLNPNSIFTDSSAFDIQIIGKEIVYPGVSQRKISIGNLRKSGMKIYNYYYLIPFILFVQAFLFYIPYYIWRKHENGLVLACATGRTGIFGSLTNEKLDSLAETLADSLFIQFKKHRIYAYMFFLCEFLCFINLFFQLWFLDWFFEQKFLTYGFDLLNYCKGKTNINPMTFLFPFKVKCIYLAFGTSGDISEVDAICHLPVNCLNDKIFLVVWVWLYFIGCLTLIQLAYRITILIAWNLYPYLKHSNNKKFDDLEFIYRVGNEGDKFLINMLSSNLDPIIFKKVIDKLSIRLIKFRV